MTFGQHLGELRDCLMKAVAGLAVGFIIGLLIGGHVVTFIQRPLSRALTRYYEKESEDRVKAEVAKLKEAGEDIPWTPAEITHRVEEEKLLAEEIYLDPDEVIGALKRTFPTLAKDLPTPKRGEAAPNAKPAAAEKTPSSASEKTPSATPADKMIRLFLWHRSADDPRVRIKSLNAQEAFGVYVKASLLVGVLLASPWLFFQIWNFVAAGLYPHERRYVHMYLPFSLGLFLVGAGLAFFVVFEPVLNFLFSFNRSMGIDPDPRINEWLGFVLMLPLGFGIAFQLPLVMLFLERIGVFSVANYLSQWRVAVLVIFVVAAILTPPDPYSMMLMAAPLSLLYFGGVALCKLLPKHKSPYRELTPR